MAHPLSPVSTHDSTSDPLSSSTHEVKAYDDPLQSHAAAWSTPPSKAEDETQHSTLHTKTTTKPIAIPRTLLEELNDPEATPTAPPAFPSTPTSSSSLHGGGGDRPWHGSEQHEGEHDSDEDASCLAGGTSVASSSADVHAAQPPVQTSPKPALKPVSIKALRTKICKAAGRGDLSQLVSLLHPDTSADKDSSIIDSEYPSSFALVNSSTATGSIPLLEAASHGHLHVVRYLVEEEGAMRDLEDSQGENAFLKAAYRGHLDIMKYLHRDALSEQEHQNQEEREEDKHSATGNTDVNVADKQGWTALHNACSKGYLEIVMWLAEHGAEIDARSHQGYTVSETP